jgi:hypothetical protein
MKFDTHLALFSEAIPGNLLNSGLEKLHVLRGSRPWSPSFIFSIESDTEQEMRDHHGRFCRELGRLGIPTLIESELDAETIDLKANLDAVSGEVKLSKLVTEERDVTRFHVGDGHWYVPSNIHSSALVEECMRDGYHHIEVTNEKYLNEPYYVLTVQTAEKSILARLEIEMRQRLERYDSALPWVFYKREELFAFNAYGGVAPLPIVVGLD